MKRQVIACGVAVILGGSVFAEAKSVELTLAQIQANRRAIVEATVAPTPQQAEEFWQTYWEYRGQIGVLNNRTVKVIEEFRAAEATLTGDRAAAVVNEVLDIETTRAAMKQKYLGKLKDVLVPKQLARWSQTERKMDSIIWAELALKIPFEGVSERPALEMSATELRSVREKLMRELLQLKPKQEKPFWNKYRQHANRTAKLEDRLTELVKEYADSYGELTAEQALSMTKAAAEIDADRMKQMERAVRAFQAILTARQMLRFLQVELKVDAMIDFVLAVAVPFEEGE